MYDTELYNRAYIHVVEGEIFNMDANINIHVHCTAMDSNMYMCMYRCSGGSGLVFYCAHSTNYPTISVYSFIANLDI